jgi:hypothetical protein
MVGEVDDACVDQVRRHALSSTGELGAHGRGIDAQRMRRDDIELDVTSPQLVRAFVVSLAHSDGEWRP